MLFYGVMIFIGKLFIVFVCKYAISCQYGQEMLLVYSLLNNK